MRRLRDGSLMSRSFRRPICVDNDLHLNWPGARILNMEAVKQVKGKRGGLAIIISPELEYTEIIRLFVGEDKVDHAKANTGRRRTQVASIFGSEHVIPNEELDAQAIEEGAERGTSEVGDEPQTQLKEKTNDTGGRDIVNEPVTGSRGQAKKKKRRKPRKKKPPPTEMIQAITVELTNGLRVTGAYISPVTKGPATDKFLRDTLKENGLKQIIVGDLNARTYRWDKGQNTRGIAVEKAVNNTERTQVVAADTTSYFKVINKTDDKGHTRQVELSSNPDIGITRIQNTVATVQDKHWQGISDHRPLILKIPCKVDITDVRKRIAKALFYTPVAREQVK